MFYGQAKVVISGAKFIETILPFPKSSISELLLMIEM